MTHPNSFLPLTAEDIVSTVVRFGQVSSSQLRRLHYKGTDKGKKIRSRRHLTRLTKLGMLKRVWGIYDSAPEYIYLPPNSKARTANMHTLDITELYVGLVEPQLVISDYKTVIFDPEPLSHVPVGHMILKPDCYIDTGKMRYFGEIDRGTEFSAVLAQKMHRYVAAYEQWEESTFPLVVWICHDADRKRFIEAVVKRQSIRGLFTVVLFDDAVKLLTN